MHAVIRIRLYIRDRRQRATVERRVEVRQVLDMRGVIGAGEKLEWVLHRQISAAAGTIVLCERGPGGVLADQLVAHTRQAVRLRGGIWFLTWSVEGLHAINKIVICCGDHI